MFNSEINPSAAADASLLAIILASVIFIGVPAVLSIDEYRITQKTKQASVI